MRKNSIPSSNQQIYENTRNTDECVIYKNSPPCGPKTILVASVTRHGIQTGTISAGSALLRETEEAWRTSPPVARSRPSARERGPPAGGCDAFGRPAPRAARVLRGPGRVSPVPTSRAGGRAGTARAETGRDVVGREGDYRPFRARSSATRSGAATTRNPKQQTAEF